MHTFRTYRRDEAALSATHDENQMNPVDEPQFEGVIFADGKCVIHWLTAVGSVSVFDSFEDMMAIHGHPEYGSKVVWQTTQRAGKS